MRRLTDQDLINIAGSTIQGYHVEGVRFKRGTESDSGNYGIILGRDSQNYYVTWQFHLLDDGSVSAYWGHYHGENRETALKDFNTRDMDLDSQPLDVTITGVLNLTVEVETEDQIKSLEAERTEKIAIHKCHNCGNMAENTLIADDGEPHIICNWCGAEIDIPFDQADDIG